MVRMLLDATAALALLGASAPALAGSCKDPKTGKFMKCPEEPAKAVKCKDAKGKFAKCGTPGAKPIG